MTGEPSLRRSVLYMPGSNQRALDKAKSIPADALIFDLEDAVAPDAKVEARANALAAARSGEYGTRAIAIRANGLDTPWGRDDLAAIATSGAAAVVMPKVSTAAYLDVVWAELAAAGAPDSLAIWAMIETATGIFDVRDIAGHPRVEALIMGTNDLIKELRCATVPDRGPVIPHLTTAILGAREAGITILDGVYNDVRDPEGFLAEARQGKLLGFDGKALVHPTQVEVANEVWAPSPDEIEHARRVIAAFEAALAEGKGVVTVDGRMVENMHVDDARRVLAAAATINSTS